VSDQFVARRATLDDRDLVTTIITLAFATDPLWAKALQRADGSTRHHFAFWRLAIDGALRYPWVWLTEGGEAAAVWIPPGGTEMSTEQEEVFVDLAREELGEGAESYLERLSRFAEAHPKTEPHYYLSLLGTHPAHRGRGIGMQLMAHNLAIIDAEHRASYLESSNPSNDGRYVSVGFETVGTFTFPGGEPVVTTMWRAAR